MSRNTQPGVELSAARHARLCWRGAGGWACLAPRGVGYAMVVHKPDAVAGRRAAWCGLALRHPVTQTKPPRSSRASPARAGLIRLAGPFSASYLCMRSLVDNGSQRQCPGGPVGKRGRRVRLLLAAGRPDGPWIRGGRLWGRLQRCRRAQGVPRMAGRQCSPRIRARPEWWRMWPGGAARQAGARDTRTYLAPLPAPLRRRPRLAACARRSSPDSAGRMRSLQAATRSSQVPRLPW